MTLCTLGQAYVSVPVLSNTIVSALAIASINLPPFTVILSFPASLIAESTASGIESLSAHEKSTISTDNALVIFLVNRYVSPVVSNEYGTSLSASLFAIFSVFDLSFSLSSIIDTILSYLLCPFVTVALRRHSPSSTTVPAYTLEPALFSTGTDSPVSEA